MRRSNDKNSVIGNIDWFLLGLVLLITLLGIVSIANATCKVFTGDEATISDFINNLDFEYPAKQMMFLGIGMVVIAVVMFVDYMNIRDFAEIFYWLCVAMLVLVLFMGTTNRGTTGWFMIGEFGFQPSEVAKLAIIISLAKVFSNLNELNPNGIYEIRQLFPAFWRFAIPLALVLAQNEMGTAMVYVVILFGTMIMAKVPWKIILLTGGSLLGICVAALVVMYIIEPDNWRIMRILTFLDPTLDTSDSGYNVMQSKIAIGSGGVAGKGYFAAGNLSQLDYIPENHTDFIFSVTAEAVGFLGGTLLIVAYLVMILRMIRISGSAKDEFGALLVMGVVFMFVFHIFENIGMTMGVMPVTGIPLPLFSYGGSSLITSLIAVALVLNVHMRRTKTG